MTDTNFAALGLAEPLLRALSGRGHETPTPIQAQAIPALLEGRDMLGLAQTGSGKTGAFALPILHRLAASGRGRVHRAPRALILAPTRELAVQIGDELRAYGRFMDIRHTVILGGVGQRPQVAALSRGVDVVVATPGRLLDLMEQRKLTLDHVETFVLDEADRMLDMGFIRDVRRIAAELPPRRQSLLFSATMPKEIASLAAELLREPLTVETETHSTPVERISQSVRHMETGAKKDALAELFADRALSRVIVFTRTKRGADRVAKHLESARIGAEAIHGGKAQNARQRALEAFKRGQVRALVATDIAARGIDVSGVTHVVNFELPNEPESYVHRIGRTARAGASGEAISLCAPDERPYLRDIEKLIRMKIGVVGGVDPEPAPRPGELRKAGAAPGGAKPRRRRPRRRGAAAAAQVQA